LKLESTIDSLLHFLSLVPTARSTPHKTWLLDGKNMMLFGRRRWSLVWVCQLVIKGTTSCAVAAFVLVVSPSRTTTYGGFHNNRGGCWANDDGYHQDSRSRNNCIGRPLLPGRLLHHGVGGAGAVADRPAEKEGRGEEKDDRRPPSSGDDTSHEYDDDDASSPWVLAKDGGGFLPRIPLSSLLRRRRRKATTESATAMAIDMSTPTTTTSAPADAQPQRQPQPHQQQQRKDDVSTSGVEPMQDAQNTTPKVVGGGGKGDSSSSPISMMTTTTTTTTQQRLPPPRGRGGSGDGRGVAMKQIQDIHQYKTEVADVKDRMVVVRFYARKLFSATTT
jgi:hypothetical protein